jgi:hypothetical protein
MPRAAYIGQKPTILVPKTITASINKMMPIVPEITFKANKRMIRAETTALIVLSIDPRLCLIIKGFSIKLLVRTNL